MNELVPYVVMEPMFYDREIKCVITSLAVLANMLESDNGFF